MIYDYLILTNGPGFYKVALFNKLNKLYKIKVIFQSATSDIRSPGHCVYDFDFDYEIVSNSSYERRNKLSCFIKTANLIIKTKYKCILHSGWESIELIPFALFLPKNKNGIVIESSIIETKKTGFSWFVKKKIIKNMAYGFPSGKLQSDILSLAEFTGEIHATYGVGLPKMPLCNKSHFLVREPADKNLNYLFVGRLAPEKNIHHLIDVFKKTKRKLTIVGDGPLRESVESRCDENIKYLVYIENSKLYKIYNAHDCFILPSISEPWGLVVEEALMHGLPVVISNNVGCKVDLVDSYNSGVSFDVGDDESFFVALDEMESNYELYRKNTNSIDFNHLTKLKINAYSIIRD